MLSSNTSAVSGDTTYIEDVFSTYLYTGNGSTQNIVNGIDLAGKGGMTWLKYRSGSAGSIYHHVYDSERGKSGNTSYNYLYPNTTSPQGTGAYGPTSFNSDGFSLNSYLNESTIPYVSWTFRKQPKFFDVVTWTGDGNSNRQISHSLASTPGCVIVKKTSAGGTDWIVYHRGCSTNNYLALNLTDSQTSGAQDLFGNGSTVNITSTYFAVGSINNDSGATYVGYVFAHNAGGFGLTGTDNVISCGSFTTDGSGNATINIGYEPQYFLYKSSSNSSDWTVLDIMRGFSQTQYNKLYPNGAYAESVNNSNGVFPTATGIQSNAGINGNQTYIYIAIRRGPMKVPTDGTKVFDVGQNRTSIASQVNGTVGPMDMTMQTQVPTPLAGYHFTIFDRVRGQSFVQTAATNGEAGGQVYFDTNVGVRNGAWFSSGGIWYNYKRAPGFFDEVCYTGNDAFNRAIPHNLAAVPELVITKVRSTTANWAVYCSATGLGYPMALNTTAAAGANPYVWGTTAPTSTNFYIGDDTRTNGGGFTYVSYLFATCPGVSKVFSYTGNGSSQTINCGFTAGARFILIKRTDSTGDWYVWDTARGIVSGSDPHLSLNTTAAEVTTDDTIDPDSTGFIVNQLSATNVNVSSATYVGIAIA